MFNRTVHLIESTEYDGTTRICFDEICPVCHIQKAVVETISSLASSI